MSDVTNWPVRFAEMVDFVGLSEEDRQLIKASAPIILAHAHGLSDVVYDHLLKYPQARKFFVTDSDAPDPKRIQANKDTMLSWLRGWLHWASPSTPRCASSWPTLCGHLAWSNASKRVTPCWTPSAKSSPRQAPRHC